MITPEIRELQVFLALAKTGSFSAAAKHLGVTQPAVSAQIAKLEQEIGFSLFFRSPEGTSITEQGKALIPIVEEIEQEYSDLLRRAAYWKRSQTKKVKVWLDGSKISRHAHSISTGAEAWQDLGASDDWISALKNFEVDIVVAGSFLKAGDVSGIKTSVIYREPGVTIAWNPTYYLFHEQPFSFPDALRSTAILPSPSMAFGFREFLSEWCESAYGFPIVDCLESVTEADALDACKLGLGVMMFPGSAEARMDLTGASLRSEKTFKSLLPKAFTYGVRHRADEQSSQVLATVKALTEGLSKLVPPLPTN